jgi:hypothetical protein
MTDNKQIGRVRKHLAPELCQKTPISETKRSNIIQPKRVSDISK